MCSNIAKNIEIIIDEVDHWLNQPHTIDGDAIVALEDL